MALFMDLSRSVRDVYFLLTSSIIPRPIAFISSLSGDDIPNLAPMRYDILPLEQSRYDVFIVCKQLFLLGMVQT